MNSAKKLLDLAELGHAAYGQFVSPVGPIRELGRTKGGKEMTISNATWPAAHRVRAKARYRAAITRKAKSQ